jgi:hypothetical protein
MTTLENHGKHSGGGVLCRALPTKNPLLFYAFTNKKEGRHVELKN